MMDVSQVTETVKKEIRTMNTKRKYPLFSNKSNTTTYTISSLDSARKTIADISAYGIFFLYIFLLFFLLFFYLFYLIKLFFFLFSFSFF